MSTAQELDYSTLKWVKSEIDENLKQTRQALETYVENPEDATQLRFCITYLHQIYGTLQMVEIYGGALLAEEMEKITLALIEDKVKQKDAAYDVIMRAILQLPSYLEHLEAGEQDRPVILLPLLNDLRSARGETLLSENAFFSPNLTIDAPVDEDEKKGDKAVNLSVYAKKLRSVFQSSLVGLYRGETPKANLRKIGAVFKELLVHSESPSAKRLWWVSGGVIEALFTGGLESNIHIKQLISQIDGEIKRVIADGDKCFDESPPTELLKNLLFYVASSKTGGKRVDQLKKLFDLDKLIPSGGDISQLFERLRGSNQELLSSVSAVVKEDLLQIKDQLDVFVRSEDRSVEQLASFSEQISRISDTLAMLGLGDLHKILQDQKKNISEMVASGERPNEAHLMEIASSLLYIESSLESIEASDLGKTADESDGESGSVSLPASQRKKLNKFVLAEACDVLGKVKESFNTYATNSSDSSIISDVPTLLNHVKGVLSVLMLERPAKLLHVTVRYITEEIIEKNNIPNAAALDEIADLITSVEYYLEAVTDSRGNIESILDIAEQSVKKLGYSLETIDYLQPLNVEGSVLDSVEKAIDPVIERTATDSNSVDSTDQNLDFSPPNSNLAIDLEPEPTGNTTPVAAMPAPSLPNSSNDEIDEEILEIFIEEADEILGSMHENLQMWKLNSTETDPLLTLRRSYHTIKGSGRLAGANVVGDFAWGVENILNKILESKLEVTPALFQLLDESESAIVLLISQLKGQSVELPDIAELTSRADAFCNASGATAPKHQPIEAALPVEEPVSNDTKLADIFKKEVRVHIETVRNYLDVFAESEINTVAEPLMRALHTLYGSARVAKATSISILSEPLDKYFTVLYETQAPISAASIRLLEEIVSVIEPMAKVFDGITECKEPDNMDQLLAAVAVEFDRVKESSQKVLQEKPLKGIAEAAAEQELEATADNLSAMDVDITLELPAKEVAADTIIDENIIEASMNELAQEANKEDASYSVDLAVGSIADTNIDPELILIFVQEAGEILSNISEILEEWTENPSDIPIMEELQRTLHTLRSGAKMTKQTAINELCDQMERALSHYVMSNIDPGKLVTTLFRECHSWLVSVLADIHKIGEHAPQEFIKRLLSISEVAQTSESQSIDVTDPVEQPTIEMPIPDFENSVTQDSMPRVSFSEESTTTPDFFASDEEHVDKELVGIFLEEAAELTLQTEKVLDSILSDPANVEYLTALKRLLHTLKGGARMAGVMSIANVTHTVETVLEQVIDCEQQIDDKATKLLLAFNEWINDAVGQVSSGQLVLLPPAKLIHEIENLLQDVPVAKRSESIEQLSEEIGNIDLVDSIRAIDEIALDDVIDDDLDDVNAIDNGLKDDAAIVVDSNKSIPTEPVEIELSETSIPEFSVDTSQSSISQASTLDEEDDDDDDDDLTQIFLEEADEIQESIEEILTEWQNDISNKDHIIQLQRALHTLKGGARMAGIDSVGDLSHAIESLLEDVIEKDLAPTAQFADAVQMCHDWLVLAISQLKEGHDVASIVQLEKRLGNLRQGNDMNLGVKTESLVSAATIAQPFIETIEKIETKQEQAAPVAPLDIANLIQIPTSVPKHDASEVPIFRTSPRNPDEQIRVKADLIDTMVNHAGEMNIYNSRIDQQLNGWQFNLAEMNQTVQRLHEQLRKFEIEAETQIMYRHSSDSSDENADFDPLELDRFSVMQQLSRGMVESLGDLHSIQTALDDITSDADVLLLQQSRINTDLHEGLMRTRLTPFSSVTARLKRIVRQTCQELGKEARLDIVGADGEMDRSQLNRVVPALEHILRNAVDHGLEIPKQRSKAKKSAEGSIQLDFSREGSEIVIRISDDGAGINLDLLRKKAIERELIRPDTNLPDHELIEYILESGFSTATNVTQISGRGVGMDVVNNEIKQLNGSLHIDTTKNKGSVFTIRLPLTVLVNQALMLSVNESKYALPLSGIEHIIRVSGKELNALNSGEQKFFEYAGNEYDNLNLHQILHGIRQKPTDEKIKLPLILAHSGDQRVALHIDQILGRNEIVIKSVGPQLSSLANISGATILPDGGVALILDITSLIRSSHTMQLMLDSGVLDAQDMVSAVEEQTRPLVMIVDDSITVRKVTERLLKRHDYDTITAKDGVDALTVLLEQLPDIMLLDVEMPRMDGFELATTMRNDARLKNIPIIMITSRTGDKHRDRALKIGVNDYMGKPYQEQELISNINALIAAGKTKES